MKRTEPQSIREVLEEAVRQSDMESELLRQRAIALWPKVAGTAITNATGRPFFRGDVMLIAVHRPALRQELTMMRSSLAKTINDILKTNVISELRFIGIDSNPLQRK